MKSGLDKLVADGWVTAVKCGSLTMYHYSQKCVWEDGWNELTRQARGLVLDAEGRVVARPWQKFFNMGERPETQPSALPAEVPELSVKLDGSLAIVFWNPETERWQGTTKGSFESEQARWINEKWLPRQTHQFDQRVTYLFELVAPWNRIVVSYPRENMVLIGMVGTEDGYDWSYSQVAEYALRNGLSRVSYEIKHPRDVRLDDPGRTNEEGYVARFSNGLRVKLKFEHYKMLHKILTGLSVKGVWEALQSGVAPDLSAVPDEFIAWYRKVESGLLVKFDGIKAAAASSFARVPRGCDRKTSALAIQQEPREFWPIMFGMLDGRDVAPMIWKQCRPEKHEVFKDAEL